MKRKFLNLCRSTDGAVAPVVALSLTALIAAGGIAFDYARVASMDTELQGAADQAALAAASQLDGQTGACARAGAAAVAMVSNRTYMANDNQGVAVTIPTETACDATGQVRLYQDVGKTQPATSDANAKFVEVTVNTRRANYALTPIVAAFHGDIAAKAFAGMDSVICRVPPVMICNPQETAGNRNFDISGLIGKGLRLVSQGGGSGTWAPGNYGYLDVNTSASGPNGAVNAIREGLGWGNPPGDCVKESGVDTKPGVSTTVTDALNTRFDIYDGNTACLSPGSCPASINSLKDVKRAANASGGNSCKFQNGGWQFDTSGVSYYGADYPRTNAPLDPTVTPSAMGHPRDICHSVDPSVPGACTGPIGDGQWDRDAYFRTNYGWAASDWPTYLAQGVASAQITTSTPTRYQVYQWEIANRGTSIGGKIILGPNPAGATGTTPVSYGQPVCSPIQGYGNGSVPDTTTPDRRKISVAVVNCLQQSVNGNSTNVLVKDWIDAFLVEPSLNRQRTNAGDIYVEVIGRTDNASTSGAVQVIKKSVPYLIE